MKTRPTLDDEYAKLIASTRYTRQDFVANGITAVAAVLLILIAMSQLGSN